MVKDLWPAAGIGICAVCCATAGTMCLRGPADPAGGAPLWPLGGRRPHLVRELVREACGALPRATSGTRAGGRALRSLPPHPHWWF